MKEQSRTQAKLGLVGWGIILLAFALGLWSGPLAAQGRGEADDRVEYRVKPGDTLIALSAKYFRKRDDWQEVQRVNRIADPFRLQIGQRISVPVRLLRSTRVDLKVENFTGPVRIGNTRARVGLDVRDGVVVQTGAGGFVTLGAASGDTVSLPSQTSVRVVRARRYVINDRLDVLFSLVRGRAIFSPTPKREGDRFRVRTPVAVTAVRGTTFRIFHEEGEERSGTEVVEGTVALSGEDGARALDEGFGNVATATGLLPVEQLLPAPAVEDPGRVQTADEVEFAILPVTGATGYRVQVASDAGFLDVVAQDVTEAPTAVFEDIANGTWFVRAQAIAPSGLEGLSQAYSFRRQKIGLVASAEETPLGNGFKFAWRGGDTTLYDFRLWVEGREDRPLVAELGMRERELVLTDLPVGVYYWQVIGIEAGPDGLVSAPTAPQKLTVSP